MDTDALRRGDYGVPTQATVLALCYALDTARRERDVAVQAIGGWSRQAGALSVERDRALAALDALTVQCPDTLEYAKRAVREGMDKGITCPCCGQLAKVYKRGLNANMAMGLLWLVRAFLQECRWYSIGESPTQVQVASEFAKLLHWGLIETAANENPSKKASGLYKPTVLGISFAKGWVAVQSHVILYDNNCLGFAGNQIMIQEALGTKFNYAELMAGVI